MAKTPTKPNNRTVKICGTIVLSILIGVILFTLFRVNQSSDKTLISVRFEDSADPVIVAVGDIACDPASPYYLTTATNTKQCQMQKTAYTTQSLNPTAILVLGDNQYEKGEFTNYQTSFDKSWGTLKQLIKPVPGNHEYYTPGAAGYYQYFGAAAHPENNGYYSYKIGSWHIIALNSNCAEIGGCDTQSPQYKWLAQDLATNGKKCTLAYWHHPRFSSGEHGDNPISKDFWKLLYDKKADVILNGHDHIYERFELTDPSGAARYNGMMQFTVGTGGKNLTGYKKLRGNSAFRQNSTFGVLSLTLSPSSYNYKFVDIAGVSSDAGTQACN